MLNILQKSFLNDEKNFLLLFSFFLISFLSLHFIMYLNFFKFSDSWIENESRTVTIQISPHENEKIVPEKVQKDIIDFFSEKDIFEYIKPLSEKEFKNYLGLDDFHNLSNIRIPYFVNLKKKENQSEEISEGIENFLDSRSYEVIQHKNEIYEIQEFFLKVKLLIFLIGLIIFILFLSFLILIINASLEANFKFLEIIQIMGTSNEQLSINISITLMKRIMLGTLLGIIFSIIISVIIIKLFSIPFENFLSLFNESLVGFSELFFYLSFFVVLTLTIIFVSLTVVIFNFLEKRFFV